MHRFSKSIWTAIAFVCVSTGTGGCAGEADGEPEPEVMRNELATFAPSQWILNGSISGETVIDFSYDNGLLTEVRYDDGETFTFEYDAEGRLERHRQGASSTTYLHDENGIIGTEGRRFYIDEEDGDETTQNSEFTYEWDGQSRIVRSTSYIDSETLEFGAAGVTVTGEFVQEGEAEYDYVYNRGLDSLHSESVVTRPIGDPQTLTLDAQTEYGPTSGELLEVTYIDAGGGTLADGVSRTRFFNQDAEGRITRVFTNSTQTDFEYDDLGRMIAINYSSDDTFLDTTIEYDDDVDIVGEAVIGVPSSLMLQRIIAADLGGQIHTLPNRHFVQF